MTLKSYLRRIERLQQGAGHNDPCYGLAKRLFKARREADDREMAGLSQIGGGENPIERYHRIKFSDIPEEKAEAKRLRKMYWPHLSD